MKKSVYARLFHGPLLMVAMFLLMSALVRIGVGGSQAFARENWPAQVATQKLPPTEPEPRVQSESEILGALLEELSDRELSLTDREKVLDERFVELRKLEGSIATQVAALQEAEDGLRQTLTIAEEAAAQDVAQLAAVFESMKPKDAAKLFEEMDPNFAAGFLAKMKPPVAAALMSGLKPDTAYTISVILAGRNARAPKQ